MKFLFNLCVKQLRVVLSFIITLMSCFALTAADVETYCVDGVYYQLYEPGNGLPTRAKVVRDAPISEPSSYKGDVIIPRSVSIENQTYEVGKIEVNAFYESRELKTVSIIAEVTQIPANCFKGCTKLTRVDYPKSVTKIGDYSFSFCFKLEEIVVGSNDINYPVSIGTGAFYGSRKLSRVVLNKSVTSIGKAAFYGCDLLRDVTFDAKCVIPMLDMQTFSGCHALKRVIIPASVKEIDATAFEKCDNLSIVAFEAGTPPYWPKSQLGDNAIILAPTTASIDAYTEQFPLNTVTTGLAVWHTTGSTFTIVRAAKWDGSLLSHDINCQCDNRTFQPDDDGEVILSKLQPQSEYTMVITDQAGVYPKQTITLATKDVTLGNFRGSSINSVSFEISDILPSDFERAWVIIDDCEYTDYSVATDNFSTIVTVDIPEARPNQKITAQPFAILNGTEYTTEPKLAQFHALQLPIEISGIGPTTAGYSITEQIESDVISEPYLQRGDERLNGYTGIITGLEPDSENIIRVCADDLEYEGVSYYNKEVTITTPPLTLGTVTAELIGSGKTRLAARTNMAVAETQCGIQYVLYNADSDEAPAEVPCPVFDGKLATTIEGLQPNVWYKTRAYYRSASGTYYYGEWAPFICDNSGSDLAPIVYTYDAAIQTDEAVIISGVAIAGSSPIISQGFEVWIEDELSSIPPVRIDANGERMTTAIPHQSLRNATYSYRAYVVTGNATTYGNTYNFTERNGGGAGIDAIEISESESPALIDVYDINGRIVRRQVAPSDATIGLLPGFYIAGGRKILVK